MKIGAFATLHKVSIDTIRHYIDLGLLMPEKQGGQYFFDERCGKDLEEVNSLKTMGFTLSEIRTVFMFRRLGRMSSGKQEPFIQELFVDKYGRISVLLEELKQISGRLEKKIKEFEGTKEEKPLRLGLQLRNLGLLRCPDCKGELNLRKAQIEDNQVMEGMLDCGCGMKFNIWDGILFCGQEAADGLPVYGQDMASGTGGANDANSADGVNGANNRECGDKGEEGESSEVPDNFRISDYIRNTDEAYLKNVSKNLEWTYRRLNFGELDGKVLLELGSGLGFFLRLIYDELPENALYIAVDHDIRKQRNLKQLLENSGKRRNILFICSDFLQIPIRENSADIVLDLTGTSNYSFEHEEFLLKPVLRYFSNHAILLGSYILFGNFSAGSKITAGFRKNFKIETIKKELSALGFVTLSEFVSDYMEKGGKYESYFSEGERVNSCVIHAKRSGVHEV